ncbi:PepSY domain-containing protein [Halomonas sp. LR3S48]|uniref:PepSY domain-containing protein n=1 Tax=Halomonas sp. LR3S48 TaxID=2982694 RepID=UPI0021E3994B|nr:PepSY domain-containing protein [Halomonas sp. LR3S48]UYG04906.1 PepSY domain-containing protein [Halomonas sp. LR3S48]
MTTRFFRSLPSRWRAATDRRVLGILLLSALLGLTASHGLADDHWRDLHDAVRSGRLVALPEILDWLEARYEGQVLEVELERDDGRTTYEVEMLGPQGQVVEFEFDAESGELIGMEGVNIDGMRRKEEAQ